MLPVGHPWFVQRHKVNLTGRTALGAAEEHFVVPFAEELESLRLLMHEHAIEVTRLYGADFYCFVSPAHDLACADVRH